MKHRDMTQKSIPPDDEERGIPGDIGSHDAFQRSGERPMSATSPAIPRSLIDSRKIRWIGFWKNPHVILLSALGFLPTLGAIYMVLDGNFMGEPAARGECPSDGFTGCHTGALGFAVFSSLFWLLVFAHWRWPDAMERGWENAGDAG